MGAAASAQLKCGRAKHCSERDSIYNQYTWYEDETASTTESDTDDSDDIDELVDVEHRSKKKRGRRRWVKTDVQVQHRATPFQRSNQLRHGQWGVDGRSTTPTHLPSQNTQRLMEKTGIVVVDHMWSERECSAAATIIQKKQRGTQAQKLVQAKKNRARGIGVQTVSRT